MQNYVFLAFVVLITLSWNGTLISSADSPVSRPPQLILTVNSLLDDTEDPGDIGDGSCDVFPLVSGDTCTLRAAIEELNAYGESTGSPHQIHFSFSGPTPYTIMPDDALPPVDVSMVINGLTVGGTSCPGSAGDVATLHMVLDGSNAPSDAKGLRLRSGDDSTVRGLVIGNFGSSGLTISGNSNVVQCNLIGVAPDGSTPFGNGGYGISLSGNFNLIGGEAHDDRNILADNHGDGIRMAGSYNTIQQNYIGTTADGLSDLANGFGGLFISGSHNKVGGVQALSGNLISGSDDPSLNYGVRINNGDDNEIFGNLIGTDRTGTAALGNNGNGIEIFGEALDNKIGSTSSSEANTIAYNNGRGVVLDESLGNNPNRNTIRGNSIFGNGGSNLGIDLNRDGVTANDGAPDGDSGANGLLNFPELSNAFTDGSRVTYTLDYAGTPNAFHTLDFYLNDSCDSSGYGEGQTFAAESGFSAGGTGTAAFTSDFAQSGAAGKYLVATVTLGSAGTSEFSACALIADAGTLVVNTTDDKPDADTNDGRCDTDTNPGNGDTCPLRAALEQANALPGTAPINIEFDLPDAGNDGETLTIDGTPLPPITRPVILDATTQPGASCPKNTIVGVVHVTVDGDGVTGDGLTLDSGSDGSTIRGFSIINFDGDAIQINSSNNTVQCNYLGLAADGQTAVPNAGFGVDLAGDANTVGGDPASLRNVISGNQTHGVRINNAQQNNIVGNYIGPAADGETAVGNTINGIRLWNGDTTTIAQNVVSGNGDSGISLANGSSGNQITANYVGLDRTGTQDRGNGVDGIELNASNSNTIGGSDPADGNVVSGNSTNGIRLIATDFTTVRHNIIGLNAAGTLLRSNDADGITINNSDQNTVEDNLIKGNQVHGIAVRSLSQRNTLSRNSIYNNSGLGIDLDEDGITPNDAAPDSDGGGNNLQNYLVLHTAAMDLVVVGMLESNYSTVYELEFFGTSSCLGSGEAEGETYLGSHFTTTDAAGIARFSAPISTTAAVGVGDFIVATATAPNGDTSEFSSCIQVEDALIINDAGDEADTNAGDGSCDGDAVADGPQCTLRAAIEEANALAAADKTIYFAIPGSGPHTIAPTGFLPSVTQTILLDGLTHQFDAACPNDLQITIDGSAVGGSTIDGLNLSGSSSGSTVQGVAIGGFPRSGIRMRNTDTTLRCNYLGLAADGTTILPNGSDGVAIVTDGVTVGGSSAFDRNIISGNGGPGIFVDGGSATRSNILIQHNFIGSDKNGTAARANSTDGIRIDNGADITVRNNVSSGNSGDGIDIVGSDRITVTNNTLGINAPETGSLPNSQGISIGSSSNIQVGGDLVSFHYNLIGGNTFSGVRLNSGNSNVSIQGNIIGQTLLGDDVGNGTHGIFLNGSSGIQIGSTPGMDGNTITNNGLNGIHLLGSGTGNTWRGNAILNNGGLGIDLNGDGVDAIDVGDGDGGANGTQNYPELFNAAPFTGTTEIVGRLSSMPGQAYTLDFYRSFSCDGSGNGEGRTWIGAVNLSHGGNNTFFHTLPVAVAEGEQITAVATDSNGSSSEFSACIEVAECTTQPAPINPDIDIVSGSVQLSWSPEAVSNYQIFRAINDPYFISAENYGATTGTSWSDYDSDEIGNPAENHFYYVRGYNACVGEIGKRVGAFDFSITPGTAP